MQPFARSARSAETLETATAPRRVAAVPVVCAVLAALAGLDPWWPLIRDPRHIDPTIVAVHRAVGELQYFSIIAELGHLNFGESQTFEQHGTGISSSPFVPLVVHAAFGRVFGAWGWLVADVAVTVLSYFAAKWLLEQVGLRSSWAALASVALLIAGRLDTFANSALPLGLFPSPSLWLVLPMRIPRPFVTELIAMLVLVTMLRVAVPERSSRPRRDAVLFALASAALAQSDIYAAAALLPASFCIVAVRLGWDAIDATQRREALMRALWIVLVGTIALVPLFVQRSAELPDVAERIGVFAVSRFSERLGREDRHALYGSLALAALAATPLLIRRARARTALCRASLCIAALFVTAAGSAVARPLFAAVTARMVQPYHFDSQHQRTQAIAVSCALLVIAQSALRTLLVCATVRRRNRQFAVHLIQRWVLIGATLAIAAFSLTYVKARFREPLSPSHVRSDFYHYAELGDDYLRDLKSLAAELDRRRTPQLHVIATVDHELCAWWLAFRGGAVLNPDPFGSPLSDAEIEDRLIELGSLLGLDAQGFVDFVTQSNVEDNPFGDNNIISNLFWSHAKYDTGMWQLVIPDFARLHLARRFRERSAIVHHRIDAVVWFARGSLSTLRPDPNRFEVVFENQTFRMYMPRPQQ